MIDRIHCIANRHARQMYFAGKVAFLSGEPRSACPPVGRKIWRQGWDDMKAEWREVFKNDIRQTAQEADASDA